jgi:hypothetical protein
MADADGRRSSPAERVRPSRLNEKPGEGERCSPKVNDGVDDGVKRGVLDVMLLGGLMVRFDGVCAWL